MSRANVNAAITPIFDLRDLPVFSALLSSKKKLAFPRLLLEKTQVAVWGVSV